MKNRTVGALLFILGILNIFGVAGHIEVSEVVDWTRVVVFTFVGLLFAFTGGYLINGPK
tara:strand:- start:623 stop:799 length:177 start_codon:yes stop_codon:yes gene_type:complete